MKRIVVTEFPKSGGTWVVNMLADALKFNKRDIYASENYSAFNMLEHPWYLDSQDLSLTGKSVIKSHELPNSDLTNFDAQFVHLVRDGRDVAVSKWFYEKDFCVKNNIQTNFDKSFDDYIAQIAALWRNYVIEWLDLNIHTIRYEDFLVDSKKELKKLLDNLSFKQVKNADIDIAISQNTKTKMRDSLSHMFEFNTFVRKGIAGDWKTHFSDKNRSDFHDIAKDVLIYLGYDCKNNYNKMRTNSIEETIKKIENKSEDNYIVSPLTGSTNTVILKNIDIQWLTDEYRKSLKVDIRNFFKNIDSIKLLKCQDTGYQFFYPFTIEGDCNFYQTLQNISWYYMDWKWEHQVASNIAVKDSNNLEIGCGKGSFVEYLSNENIEICGLEINESQIEFGKKRGLNIYNQSIADHSNKFTQYYDNIFAFQVMEHISEVKKFISNCLKALKIGGKLVLSVPNHDSFMGLDEHNVLDMPPHHMGLWDAYSLRSLEKVFGIELLDLIFEPLQNYHHDYYLHVAKKIYRNEPLILRALEGLISRHADKLLGFTVLAVFKKN